MDINFIISDLDERFGETVRYHVFDNKQKTNTTVIAKLVSDFFDLNEWHRCIKLLNRIQQYGQERGEECFRGFWGTFLVGVGTDSGLKDYKSLVQTNVLRFESYLRFILARLGLESEVGMIQKEGDGLRRVINLGVDRSIFEAVGDSSNMMETIGCYRNWWAHSPVRTSPNGSVQLGNNQLEIPFNGDFLKDIQLLYGIVRLVLVELLLIIKRNFDALDKSVPQFTTAPAPELQFDESLYIETYFRDLKMRVEKRLHSDAIQELKADNQFGYYEHKLRFSHSKNNRKDDNEDTESLTEHSLKLSQFRRSSIYKTNIILGMPGAGKTTALYLLIGDCIRQYEKMDVEERDNAVVPIFISLKSVGSNEDAIRSAIYEVVGYCISEKSKQYRDNAFACIYKLMKEGRVVLFFDGLNEIPQEERGPVVRSLINTISNQMPPDSRVYITGREYEYECSSYSKDLEKDDDVGVWHLEELSYEQIEGFLSPEMRSQIIRGQIVELFSSPLNFRLFLNYLQDRLTDDGSGSLDVPLNRGEMLESFLANTFKDNGISPYFANQMLKRVAVSCYGHSCDKSLFDGCIEHAPPDLIDRLAAVNILSLSSARADVAEQVSFSIDTFLEFYRAKYVIDRLYEDSHLSLYSLSDNDCNLNPRSPEDYETLKLIFEIGSSPLCHQKRGFKTYDEARKAAISFSFRLAKDFLNPAEALRIKDNPISLNKQTVIPASMNPRLLTLCELVRNVPFSRDIRENIRQGEKEGRARREKQFNAKDVAELFVLNNLRWYRVQHPTPIPPKKHMPEFSYLNGLISAMSIIGGKQIWNEFFSSYWLVFFGIVIPVDYPISGVDYKQEGQDDAIRKIISSQFLLYDLPDCCRDYIYFYEEIHRLHIDCFTHNRVKSALSISNFIYKLFLCYLPTYAKKHLYYHIEQLYEKNRWDRQYLNDINTLLCYFGDSQFLAQNFRFDASGLIRVKELRYILSNYADIATQKFVLSEAFFSRLIEPRLRSLIIRYFLFRLGLTPILKEFLFHTNGINLIPEEDVEPIMDLIPLHSIPKDYVDRHYDKDICELLVKQNGVEVTGAELEYVYYGSKGNHVLVSISDIEEASFIGSECLVGDQAYTIVNDTYLDAVRLYCRVKTVMEDDVLLPDRGEIISDNYPPISYRASSPNTELNFYLYGEDAVVLYHLAQIGNKFKINDVECSIEFPEQIQDAKLAFWRFRVLELQSGDTVPSVLPYSGELRLTREINKILRPASYLHRPERFESLGSIMDVKTDVLRYNVFGQNKSFLWVLTEKIVTASDILAGLPVTDVLSNETYLVRSVRPHTTPYLEFWFKVAQRVSVSAYGTFCLQSVDGDYSTIPYGYSIISEDGLSFKLRVFDDRIVAIPSADLYHGTYLIGNNLLQLVSVDKILPCRRYSIWTLEKGAGSTCGMAGGLLYVQEESTPNSNKMAITVSAETRSNIEQLKCTFGAYDNEEGRIFFFAPKPEGTIGAGRGDINLLKGLYLNSPYLSSTRYVIDKESEMGPLWIRRFFIRFDIQPGWLKGYFCLENTKISFLRQEDDYFWLWCPSDSEILMTGRLEERLRNQRILRVVLENGMEGDHRILEIREDTDTSDYSMVIQSSIQPTITDKDIQLLRDTKQVDFKLQVQVPVLNAPNFPRAFRALYPKTTVSFSKDISRPSPGFIIVPRPVATLYADAVLLEGMGIWPICDKSVSKGRYLRIGLKDSNGNIPRVPATGKIRFLYEGNPMTVWYRHLYELVDFSHPERYHADLCGNLLEEILGGDKELDIFSVDFFIKKSRASDLVTHETLLKTIEEQSLIKPMFNVCRVFLSHPLRGLQAYSVLERNDVASSDTMPESHNGRPFERNDLVLMERNHRLTLINDLPRYHCLGYKTGYVQFVADAHPSSRNPDYRNRVDIFCPEARETFHFMHDSRNSPDRFVPGDDVTFFASVKNHWKGTKYYAQDTRLLGTRQPIVTGTFVGERMESNQHIYTFDTEEERLEIRVYDQSGTRGARYHYYVGQTYSIIKGPRMFIISRQYE